MVGLVCPGCSPSIGRFNQAVGRCVVPIGRHSIMNGVAVAVEDVYDDVVLDVFVRDMASLFETMDFLSSWAAQVVAHNLSALGRDPGDAIPLKDYLDLVDGRVDVASTAFDRLTAALSAWIVEGCPPPPDR
jgi:hypothetical protein